MAARDRRWQRSLVIAILIALLASACSSGDDDAAPPEEPSNPDQSEGTAVGDRTGGPLRVRLSAGQGQAPEVEQVSVVEGEALSDDEVAAIIGRLPEWVEQTEDQVDFNRPADSLPPPRAGDTIEGTFPESLDEPAPEVETGPLEVLRVQPEGDVDIAPVISITFNQPMVPLGTLGQLDELDVPATLTPEIPGHWQWIGTRTLRFEHDSELIDRLPMATDYVVEIPAGTASASGSTLARDVRFEFTTPTVQVLGLTPSGESIALEPVFVAVFDQRVDPDAILAATTVQADGAPVAIRLATDDEIAADEDATRAVEQMKDLDGRWIAFRAEEAFPRDTAITVTFGPDLPSAEGPRTDAETQDFDARTYAPLGVAESNCRSAEKCQPGSQLYIRMNNPLDLERFDPDAITVEPAIAGMSVGADFDSIWIQGATKGRTEYVVTLPAALTDVYGQTLGEDAEVTFVIAKAFPSLVPFETPLITADPAGTSPRLSVTTVNHQRVRVQMYAVDPSDWPAYSRLWERPEELAIPETWTEVLDTLVDTDGVDDDFAETLVDLGDGLDGEHGHLVVVVSPEEELPQNDPNYWQNRPTFAWVQVTDIAVDVFNDNDELVVWATDLATGTPLAGVEVELDAKAVGTTAATGLTSTALAPREHSLLVATKGDDVAIMATPWDRWYGSTKRDTASWHVFDDRAIYRPGETVHLKGWVRMLTLASDAQLGPVDAGTEVSYTVTDPQGSELTTGSAPLSRLGGFDFTFDVPAGANLGFAQVTLTLGPSPDNEGNRTGYHQFRIEEFRRPEFEVATRAETPGPYLRTDPATVAVEAAYFAGGPLPSAPVDWTVTTRDTTYRPPGWDDFNFGIWVPWWIFDRGFAAGEEFSPGPGFDPGVVETFSGVTDSAGLHFLQIDFEGDDTDLPVTVSAQAAVTDVNRQAWADTTDLLVHPASVYVGLRSDRTFVRQGDPLAVSVITTDIDGAAVAGRPVTVTAERLEWQLTDGEWQEVAVDPQTCELTSTDDPLPCEFDTELGGQYRVTAIVADAEDRTNRTELTLWVSGGSQPPVRRVQQEQVTLVPDKAEYQPGDTAEILVEAPFTAAAGLLTIARNGIVSTTPFDIEGSSAVLEIAIEDEHIPTLHVQVDVVGAAPRTADDGTPLRDGPQRPAFGTGQLQLDIPPTSRTLEVTATPADEVTEPGADTSVEVTVADAAGEPVEGAELAVVVVDEAVLALTGFELADPIDSFYQALFADVESRYTRASVILESPLSFGASTDRDAAGGDDAASDASGAAEEPTEEAAFAPSAARLAQDGAAKSAADTPIDVRSNFDALAVFEPEVTTDSAGKATIAVPLPDNLTRYRIMVLAVDGAAQFGSAESNLTARLPLMVRPSAPRFLNFGDRFELPVVLQNQTDDPMDVDVVLQTSNLELTDRLGTRVTVPANERIEVRFPARAVEAGTASFRVSAVSGDAADAATVALPVYTPATAEAFATYGVVDRGAVIQPLLAPADVWPQFGGLELGTSSTALQALTDAVLYVSDYPYRSTDGHASRILAVAALRDVLEAFDAEGLPEPAELDAAVQADIADLVSLQNDDGGFPIWQRFDETWPYHSVHAAHALIEAKANGYAVPQFTIERALEYLRNVESWFPATWGPAERATVSAYALHVRNLAGEPDPAKALALYRNTATENLSLEAVAWLWPVIDDAATGNEIERLFLNRATETAGAATFAIDYGETAYLVLHSDRRSDGVILDALITERPDSDLIPKVVAGLLGNQTRGRWDNMQENTFILLALNRYFDAFEAEDPDFVARIWLGDTYAAEHEYRGRTTDRNASLVPMAELIEEGDTDLVVSKDGAAGRLYYRLGLRYAPTDLDLDPLDRGFVVQRTYEGVDDPADARLDGDGVWHIRAGADIRVRVTMVADSQRTHVALIDPLPAGFEPLNPALPVTPLFPPDPNQDPGPIPLEEGFEGEDVRAAEPIGPTFPYWGWFDHQNLRDDRAEAFASLVAAGTYDYTYVARATTPGRFVTPPTRAEEIFAPETFGRSSTDIVVVEEKG